MRLLQWTIPQEQSGQTVRHLVKIQWQLSSGMLARIKFREGGILLNGRPVTVRAKVQTGDLLQVDVSDPPGSNPNILPVNYPLDILFEDEDLLIINKPAGIAIHPAALTEETVTIAGAAIHHMESDSFHCVTRLDRGTTGAMVIAKTGYVHARCMALLHSQQFYREYLGLCIGAPEPSSGTIDLPIGREPGSLLRRAIDPQGLEAQTHYKTLLRHNGLALLQLLPVTGRTHQLRLHLSAIGHPLAGDWLYGTEDHSLITRPALHSSRVQLVHPLTGQHLDITAPLPEDMTRLLPR